MYKPFTVQFSHLLLSDIPSQHSPVQSIMTSYGYALSSKKRDQVSHLFQATCRTDCLSKDF